MVYYSLLRVGQHDKTNREKDMKYGRLTCAVCALALVAGTAFADGWTLDGDMSKIAFGSVKNDYNGEVHSFSDLSGKVDAEGNVEIEIPLASVETLIDIRNERMREFVFNNSPTAKLSAAVDMAALEQLEIGDAMVAETDATLSMLGQDTALFTDLFILRVTEDKVMVTTDGMVMVATDEIGIDAGIDKLQELASLDSITRVTPVTLRLMFTSDTPGS